MYASASVRSFVCELKNGQRHIRIIEHGFVKSYVTDICRILNPEVPLGHGQLMGNAMRPQPTHHGKLASRIAL
jgi:hypothetical protein